MAAIRATCSKTGEGGGLSATNPSLESGLAGPCVAVSRIVEDMLREARDLSLPINVDGVIGAIIADMGLDPKLAKALFIFGRIMGLSAHHFEEIASQPPMRPINFSQAVYRDIEDRPYPNSLRLR